MSIADMFNQEALWWRFCMPRTVWQCHSGRFVLFNGEHQPLVEWTSQRGLRVPASQFARSHGLLSKLTLYIDFDAPWLYCAGSRHARDHVRQVYADFLQGKMPAMYI